MSEWLRQRTATPFMLVRFQLCSYGGLKMRDKKPISQDKEIIRRSKKNKSKPKKSKHKHNYVLYKEYVGYRNDDTMTMFT